MQKEKQHLKETLLTLERQIKEDKARIEGQKELIVYYVRLIWLYYIFYDIYQARVCRQPLDGVKRVAGQPG